MIPKENRLRKEKDFKRVIGRGKTFFEGFLVLKKVINKEKNTRIGLVVSLKVSKKAPERNKIKRRIREVLREEINDIKKGFDIVIFAKKEANNREYKEIKETLKKLISKANLYEN